MKKNETKNKVPQYSVGQTVWFVHDHYVNKLTVARVIDDGQGWRYEPESVKFSGETTYMPFSTVAEAEKYRLEEIEKAVDIYRKELIALKKQGVE